MEMRRKSMALCELGVLLLVQILGLVTAAQSKNSSTTWKTLSGDKPAIIARGGFSGTFPDSSSNAYNFALIASSPDTILYCDVQLTKDSVGICLPSIKLDNCTDISFIYPKGSKSYEIDGVHTSGWFSIDYTNAELTQVSLRQPIWSRTEKFDYSNFAVLTINDLVSLTKPRPPIWLNMQYDEFYTKHNISMRSYTISLSKQIVINYISSPEIIFLESISKRIPSKTKLIFRCPSYNDDHLEPSTNKSYSSILKNLTYVKSFSDGILVPKGYVWPVTTDNYLTEHTSLVSDAHKVGLEVYAADFSNDNLFSYNYSYDPLAEYLQFIDNGEFSVDGVLSDYPITPSEAVGCFTNLNKSSMDHGKPLIITHNGASGDYPDCTDQAYQKAVDDGADVIDCTVQVTKDGILICMSSISLIGITNVARSHFSSQTSVIPTLQPTPGIFTFNLTWNEIKSLKPTISAPESIYYLSRNPRNTHSGSFFRLSDFLDFAKDKDLDGIVLTLENAAFYIQQIGVDMIGSIETALNEAGYANSSTSLKVNIMSEDSSVLTKLRSLTAPKYTLIYKILDKIRDASSGSIADIKKFADAVAINKLSVFPEDLHFIINQTNIVATLQKAGLKVYVFGFMNEFVSQAWDFFADATVEINTYVQGALIDGLITDFPATARRYKRNTCLNLGNNTPPYMEQVQVGALMELIVTPAQPPMLAPLPVLSDSDVVEPPLPSLPSNSTTIVNNATGPSQHISDGVRTGASIFILVLLAISTLFVRV